jgi:hypothetical protein
MREKIEDEAAIYRLHLLKQGVSSSPMPPTPSGYKNGIAGIFATTPPGKNGWSGRLMTGCLSTPKGLRQYTVSMTRYC